MIARENTSLREQLRALLSAAGPGLSWITSHVPFPSPEFQFPISSESKLIIHSAVGKPSGVSSGKGSLPIETMVP